MITTLDAIEYEHHDNNLMSCWRRRDVYGKRRPQLLQLVFFISSLLVFTNNE